MLSSLLLHSMLVLCKSLKFSSVNANTLQSSIFHNLCPINPCSHRPPTRTSPSQADPTKSPLITDYTKVLVCLAHPSHCSRIARNIRWI
jgi:hypothetical protein